MYTSLIAAIDTTGDNMGAGRPSKKYGNQSGVNYGLRWTDNLRERDRLVDRLDRLLAMDGRTRHNTGNTENPKLEMSDSNRILCCMFVLEDMGKFATDLDKIRAIQGALSELEEVLSVTNDLEEDML